MNAMCQGSHPPEFHFLIFLIRLSIYNTNKRTLVGAPCFMPMLALITVLFNIDQVHLYKVAMVASIILPHPGSLRQVRSFMQGILS